MTEKTRIRGLTDKDDKMFAPPWIERLLRAQTELRFLLDRGYPMKSAATFVGCHHQLSARQILALTRSTSSSRQLSEREWKCLKLTEVEGKVLNIDGFNLIIALEVAISDGMLFRGQDGCIRDLAELRGTYSVIPHTATAVSMVRQAAEELNVAGIVFLLDAPVSNSGRLKTKIYEEQWNIPVTVNIVRNPDAELKNLPYVVTGDSVILDECINWFNMVDYIITHSGKIESLTRLIRLDEKDRKM